MPGKRTVLSGKRGIWTCIELFQGSRWHAGRHIEPLL
jgi:hypothetical protein